MYHGKELTCVINNFKFAAYIENTFLALQINAGISEAKFQLFSKSSAVDKWISFPILIYQNKCANILFWLKKLLKIKNKFIFIFLSQMIISHNIFLLSVAVPKLCNFTLNDKQLFPSVSQFSRGQVAFHLFQQITSDTKWF